MDIIAIGTLLLPFGGEDKSTFISIKDSFILLDGSLKYLLLFYGNSNVCTKQPVG